MSDAPPNDGRGRSSSAAGSAADSSSSSTRQRSASGVPSPLGLSGIPSLSPYHLGIGRPRAPSTDFRIGASNPSTPPVQPAGTAIPGRAGSISSIDYSDTESQHATPRTGGYFPPPEMMSRRSSDGRGQTLGSGLLMSPNPSNTQNPGSIGLGRSSRARLKDGEGTRSAVPSRSVSRVRLAPSHQPAQSLKDMDDDAFVAVDRGEDLIRRRLKERKRAKRERERRLLAEAAGEEADEAASLQGSAQAESIGTSGGRNILASPSRAGYGTSRPRDRASSSASRTTQGGVSSVSGGDVERPESVLSVQTEENSDDLAAAEAHQLTPTEHSDSDAGGSSGNEEDEESGSGSSNEEAEGVTLRDRQDAINIEHPFGLPIWKPALYRKSRTVTRNAESDLHSMPSAAAERHLRPGNIFWVLVFGWWLALCCFVVAMAVTGAEQLVGGRGGYGQTLRGLAWYIGWPFGKYVEGEGAPHDHYDGDETSDEHAREDEESTPGTYGASGEQFTNPFQRTLTTSTSSSTTVKPGGSSRPTPAEPESPVSPTTRRGPGVSFAPGVKSPDESVPLLRPTPHCTGKKLNRRGRRLGGLIYWPAFLLIVAPVMLFVCVICWFLVVTIPMAKLTWELLVLLWTRPLELNFRRAPKIAIPNPDATKDDANGADGADSANGSAPGTSPSHSIRRARLQAGQVAPTAGPTSTVLLCTYRAAGLQYYKYTVGGVNILFINLLPLVFFTIFDGWVLLPMVDKMKEEGRYVPPLLGLIASDVFIFILGLASVIPLSYFLGMAVASISAQSSIGMGAVINATFGSIIEIVLYAIALTQGKGRLVEGSIVGSILAGVLLMPGMSMCSGALKRKEQKFNAKSAGVTSTMLIMAIIGTLTPTMFYQTYGSFQLHCEGCPPSHGSNVSHTPDDAWKCNRCFYEYPEPTTDPFYQNQVKKIMYGCAVILLLSYLIGLWFSLRTHASQIWQNPSQVMAKEDIPVPSRATLARITPAAVMNPVLPVHQEHHQHNQQNNQQNNQQHNQHLHKAAAADGHSTPSRIVSPHRRTGRGDGRGDQAISPLTTRKDLAPAEVASPRPGAAHSGYTPLLDSINPNKTGPMDTMAPLPGQLTQEDFRRAVHTLAHAITNKKQPVDDDAHDGGGHEAPSWTRGLSAAVLLGCTLLYALIAEVLVDVVDVVLAGSGVDEKFLGLTLFALVPNTTEFMNAMSFAMHGNIALSMEIGSAYALQVCLLQIPAMVAFSVFTNPEKFGDQVDTFTLLFPRWDVIAIILSIFLLTYTYIEARANYHRGSILVLAYIVLVMGFYYAPPPSTDADGRIIVGYEHVAKAASSLSSTVSSSISLAMTKLWASHA